MLANMFSGQLKQTTFQMNLFAGALSVNQMNDVHGKDPDLNLPSLITVCCLLRWLRASLILTVDVDQTLQILRLIQVFAGCIGHLYG